MYRLILDITVYIVYSPGMGITNIQRKEFQVAAEREIQRCTLSVVYMVSQYIHLNEFLFMFMYILTREGEDGIRE